MWPALAYCKSHLSPPLLVNVHSIEKWTRLLIYLFIYYEIRTQGTICCVKIYSSIHHKNTVKRLSLPVVEWQFRRKLPWSLHVILDSLHFSQFSSFAVVYTAHGFLLLSIAICRQWKLLVKCWPIVWITVEWCIEAELVMGHFFKTNPKFLDPTQPNPQKSSPDPTQPIIDTWYGILGYTENFIQQLLQIKISK